MEEQSQKYQRYLDAILSSIATIKSTKKKSKLTHRILKVKKDWFQWEAAERKPTTTVQMLGHVHRTK